MFWRAFGFFKRTVDDVITSEQGVDRITAAIYKLDGLSVKSDFHHDFNSLFNVFRVQNELYLNYESRFSAQVAELARHGETANNMMHF